MKEGSKEVSRTDNFALSANYVVGCHNNIQDVVDESTGVVTTAMDLEVLSISDSKIEEDIVSKSLRNLFVSAGIPQALFTSDTSVGLREAIRNISQKMFNLNRQYENWINKRLKYYSKENKQKDIFSYRFLDVTVYNQEEKYNLYLKGGQFGYGKLYAPICLGISQLELMNMIEYENSIKITDLLKPLASSHTTSLKDSNKKSEDSLSDSGLKTRDREDNEEKVV